MTLHLSASLKSDSHALIGLAVKMNWTYIAIIYSAQNFYRAMTQSAVQELNKYHGCVASLIELSSNYSDTEIERAFDVIYSLADLNVVLTFINKEDAARLLVSLKAKWKYGATRKLIFLGTDEWAELSKDIFYGEVLLGSLFVVHKKSNDLYFNNYFQHITSSAKIQHQWMIDFWQEFFQCSLNYPGPFETACNGSETLLNVTLQQSSIIATTINAVYAYAHGVAAFLRDRCGTVKLPPCEAANLGTGINKVLYHFIKNAKFTGAGDQTFSFTENGFAAEKLTILNTQKRLWDEFPHLVEVSMGSFIINILQKQLFCIYICIFLYFVK